MIILFCNNPQCYDTFAVLTRKEKTCHCGLSSARLIDGICHYAGDHAVTMEIPSENIKGLTDFFKDKTSVFSTKGKRREDEKTFCFQVLQYLNEKSNSSFVLAYPSTYCKSILARQKETGCTLEDFFTVIDKKVKAWTGTEFEQHLNPNTLFSQSKFITYLAQKVNVKPATALGQLADAVRAAKG
jgi:uncharacterized phage protein (TIGR02220 family)